MVSSTMSTETLRILLIDDSETEVIGLKRAFDLLGIDGTILTAGTGEVGIEILKRMAVEQSEIRPPIVLLDINLPGADGLETLEIIRATPLIKDVRVFVWSGMGGQQERDAANKLDIEGFLLKTSADVTYAKAAAMLNDYWKSDRPRSW